MTSANEELLKIQKLQFNDKAAAENLVRDWFARYLDLQVDRVRLVPKAVSLNSFNGFYSLAGEEFFFKTHVEEMGIDQEYYDAQVLHQAGYNIVLPLRSIHQQGQQMVIYPVIKYPEIFNLMRASETGGDTSGITPGQLLAAEQRECQRLLEIYDATLKPSSAEENAKAKVYQLFWHRLAGERLQNFYIGKQIALHNQKSKQIAFDELLRYRWTINGKPISIDGKPETLGALIERGQIVLNPHRDLWTVVGHGDAHFGNVFLEDREKNNGCDRIGPGHRDESGTSSLLDSDGRDRIGSGQSDESRVSEDKQYLYFDPAFAGRFSPLLDIVKPFFHNVFAMWMYFGPDIARELQISVELRGDTIFIEHSYEPSPIRQAMLQVKQEQLVAPLIELLAKHRALPKDWQPILRSALLCCPLLTIDMLNRLPNPICWLGLSQVMQMGTFAFD